jgi:hypothetical protein
VLLTCAAEILYGDAMFDATTSFVLPVFSLKRQGEAVAPAREDFVEP